MLVVSEAGRYLFRTDFVLPFRRQPKPTLLFRITVSSSKSTAGPFTKEPLRAITLGRRPMTDSDFTG